MPNYEFWAPWIGNESRRSNHVFNTESFKCPKRLHIPDETEPVPDEIIKNLRDEKVHVVFESHITDIVNIHIHRNLYPENMIIFENS